MLNTDAPTQLLEKKPDSLLTLIWQAIKPFTWVVAVAIAMIGLARWLPETLTKNSFTPVVSSADSITLTRAQLRLVRDIEKMDKKLNAKTPRTYYLVINSASNEFSLYEGGKLVKRDKCSTGSYVLLKNGQNQQWMFKTPKGEFRIQGKTTSPVWKKPDWAFVEEGLPVPSADHHTRFEYGVLGDYALSLGHGYLIHGTLYQRFLGLPVTHGCIRLNDANLELVYNRLQIGSKVYIY